ncbi:hypothetical protein ACP70R_007856 [Stipagrostis hirtigluma subsp. patula]
MVNLKSNRTLILYAIAVVSMLLEIMSGTFSSASEERKCSDLEGCTPYGCLKICHIKYGKGKVYRVECEGEGDIKQCCCNIYVDRHPPPAPSGDVRFK